MTSIKHQPTTFTHNKRFVHILVLALISSVLSLLPNSSSHAFFQGQEVQDSGFVVAVKTPGYLCSGALVGERVVVTALSCLLNQGGTLKNPLRDIDIFAPDSNLISSKPVARVSEYLTPMINAQSLFPNIAFLVLDKKIGKSPISELATYERAVQLNSLSINFEVHGYGITSELDPFPNGSTPKKIQASLNLKKESYENQKDYFRFTPAFCYGDLGAPITTRFEGKVIFVGLAFSIQGSDSKCDGKGGSSVTPKIGFATIAGEYSSLFKQVTQLVEQLDRKEAEAEAEAKAKAEAEAKAKAASELKAKQDAEAKIAAEKLACQYRVSQLLEVQQSLLNSINNYPQSSRALKEVIERIQSALMSNCVSDVVLSDFTKESALVTNAARRLSENKKVSITCVKGKLTKRVTAVNPKCPTGYKKK